MPQDARVGKGRVGRTSEARVTKAKADEGQMSNQGASAQPGRQTGEELEFEDHSPGRGWIPSDQKERKSSRKTQMSQLKIG